MKKNFQIFRKYNISIKSFKTFLIYPSIRLLNQKVNFLKLTTDENKLRAINNLKFSIILRQLKHYLGLTEWLRKYVKKYVKLTKFFQVRKIMMLKKFFVNESTRRLFFNKSVFQNFIETEIQSFQSFQKILVFFRYFVHYNPKRQLYMNVNFSKKIEIDVMIYHFKQIIQNQTYLNRIMIESIMFLNKRISKPESKYWSTKLKIAKLIWILRKTRHMIDSII